MTTIAIIIIVILVVSLFGDRISAWIRGFMARRAEDAMRRMMGMPSRKEEQRARRRAEKAARSGKTDQSARYAGRQSTRSGNTSNNGPIIPKEYAEDVEYVEIKSYSESTEIHADPKKGETIYHESQVEEAEYIEIKK